MLCYETQSQSVARVLEPMLPYCTEASVGIFKLYFVWRAGSLRRQQVNTITPALRLSAMLQIVQEGKVRVRQPETLNLVLSLLAGGQSLF